MTFPLAKRIYMEALTHRRATLKDIDEIRKLFQDTVLYVNNKDYTDDEMADWAACGDCTEHWKSLIDGQYFVVAISPGDNIIGFASICSDGHLHSMYVHKDHQGEGVASLLLCVMESYAALHGIREMTSDVSITALPFFKRKGFTVEKKQKAMARKLCLTNYKMRKTL